MDSTEVAESRISKQYVDRVLDRVGSSKDIGKQPTENAGSSEPLKRSSTLAKRVSFHTTRENDGVEQAPDVVLDPNPGNGATKVRAKKKGVTKRKAKKKATKNLAEGEVDEEGESMESLESLASAEGEMGSQESSASSGPQPDSRGVSSSTGDTPAATAKPKPSAKAKGKAASKKGKGTTVMTLEVESESQEKTPEQSSPRTKPLQQKIADGKGSGKQRRAESRRQKASGVQPPVDLASYNDSSAFLPKEVSPQTIGASASPRPDGSLKPQLPVYPPKRLDDKYGENMSEDSSDAANGWFQRFRVQIEQQEPAKSTMPYFWQTGKPQARCAWFCAALFFVTGVSTLGAARKWKEVVVSYKYPDVDKNFTLSDDMDGDVNMWYSLANAHGMNQKRYVENIDPGVIKLMPFSGKKMCKDSEDQADAAWRRVALEAKCRTKYVKHGGSMHGMVYNGSAPDKLSRLLSDARSSAFRPCGLQAIAMFSDEYELYQDTDGKFVRQDLDESKIALNEDAQIFKRVEPLNSTHFKIDGDLSWLQAGSFYEHFKVWLRTPPSPHVQNLWAVARGGLKKGTYKLSFPQNSAIWTAPGGWQTEKTVIFSQGGRLGNKGAYTFMGSLCLVIAAIEAVVGCMFGMGPTKLKTIQTFKQKSVQYPSQIPRYPLDTE